jgi:hypothetical protein
LIELLKTLFGCALENLTQFITGSRDGRSVKTENLSSGSSILIMEKKRQFHAKAQRRNAKVLNAACSLPLLLCAFAPLRELLQCI